MNTKKIALVVAFDGYEYTEYNTTKKVLHDAGFTVVTVSTKKGAAIAHNGSTCTVDVALDQFNVADYDGIFLVGGPGALEDLNTLKMHGLLQKAVALHKPTGAICSATRILSNAGILEGKRATGWNDDKKLEEFYHNHNVIYVPDAVVVDGIIITAQGPADAQEYGNAIVDMCSKHK